MFRPAQLFLEPLDPGTETLVYFTYTHAITVRQRGDDVEGIVSLYNRFRHGFLLALRPGTVLEPRGHFFDIGNRIIRPLSPS